MNKQLIILLMACVLMLSGCNFGNEANSQTASEVSDIQIESSHETASEVSDIQVESSHETASDDMQSEATSEIETEFIEYVTTAPYVDTIKWDSFEELDEYVYALDWENIFSEIPSDHYEEYPGVHLHKSSCPVKATLYINRRKVELEIDDPRLVRLVNFYHNSLYNMTYAELQGCGSSWLYSEMQSFPDRLELEFEIGASKNDPNKIVLIDGVFFCVLERGQPCFCGCGHTYGTWVYIPLHAENIKWIDIFGFMTESNE
ncbi:MAG: hypothetical protein IJY39_09795 [Clostridia bacterium]|nr:hypothetical protein [Clostridia bacterium]